MHFLAESPIFRTAGVGVPKGGVLSPLLFSLTLSRIAAHIPHEVKWLMFADDLILYIRTKSIAWVVWKLEETVDILRGGLDDIGLSISEPKSQLMIFSNTNCDFGNVSVKVGESRIKLGGNLKYLGIVLDRRLTWLPHLKVIAGKATTAINVIIALAKVS